MRKLGFATLSLGWALFNLETLEAMKGPSLEKEDVQRIFSAPEQPYKADGKLWRLQVESTRATETDDTRPDAFATGKDAFDDAFKLLNHPETTLFAHNRTVREENGMSFPTVTDELIDGQITYLLVYSGTPDNPITPQYVTFVLKPLQEDEEEAKGKRSLFVDEMA